MYLNAEAIEKYLFFSSEENRGKAAQVGWDLTVKDIKEINPGDNRLLKSGTEFDHNTYTTVPLTINPYKEDQHIWVITPGVYSLTFYQGCSLPNNIKAEIVHRSSLLRMGVEIRSAVYDPGFKVEEMGAVMIAHNPVVIEKGSRVAQILMCETLVAQEYAGQWQGTRDKK